MNWKLDMRVVAGTAAGLLVVLLGGCLALIGPRNSQIANQRTLLSTAQQQAQQYETEYNQLRTGTKVSSVESQSGLLEQAIPSQVDLAGIINDVYSAAALSGVPVTSFSAPTPGSSATGVPASSAAGSSSAQAEHLTISTAGRYFQIVDFIDQLQQLPRIYVITSVSLSGGASSQPASPSTLFTPNLTAAIAASTFFTGTPPVAVAGLPTSGVGSPSTTLPGAAVPATTTSLPGSTGGVSPTTTSVPGTTATTVNG